MDIIGRDRDLNPGLLQLIPLSHCVQQTNHSATRQLCNQSNQHRMDIRPKSHSSQSESDFNVISMGRLLPKSLRKRNMGSW